MLAQMKEVLEKYLEDEDDMLDMNLTARSANISALDLDHHFTHVDIVAVHSSCRGTGIPCEPAHAVEMCANRQPPLLISVERHVQECKRHRNN